MGTAIVAIPKKSDPIWNVSSEKVPHLTILYLGEALLSKEALSYVEHCVYTMLNQTYVWSDDRGTLGSDEADVLFIGGYDIRELSKFRDALLTNNEIKNAFNSIEQYEKWTPHITIGYPDSPAKKDPDRSGIELDRIAVWFGDYSGVEFEMKKLPEYIDEDGLAMSSVGKNFTKEFIRHYGVKGMRWGQRRSSENVSVGRKTSVTGKAKLKTLGGKGLPAHNDAVLAKVAEQKLKKSGPNALSNRELQELAARRELEQRAIRATNPEGFVAKTIKNVGQQQVARTANRAATQKIDEILNEKR